MGTTTKGAAQKMAEAMGIAEASDPETERAETPAGADSPDTHGSASAASHEQAEESAAEPKKPERMIVRAEGRPGRQLVTTHARPGRTVIVHHGRRKTIRNGREV